MGGASHAPAFDLPPGARVVVAMSGTDRHAVQGAAEELEHGTRAFAERRMDRGIRKALAGRNVAEIGG